MNRKWFLPILALAAFLIFLIVCPLAEVGIRALIINDALDFSYAAETLMEEQNAVMIRNSLILGVLVVIVSTIISLPLAYLLSRTEWAESKVLDILFLVPFMTPPYIASMGWILFMQKRGLLGQLIPFFKDGVTPFFTLAGLVMVMSFHIFPFMVTLLKNAMLRVPESLDEAAAVCGAGFGTRLRKIFLPLVTGNYVIGALLVFVKTLSEYGTPYTLGRRIGFDVFTTDIHRYATIAPISFGKAAVLASVLVTICLFMWFIQNYITMTHSYRLVGGRGTRRVFKILRRPVKLATGAAMGLLFALAVGIPYFSVIATSLIKLRGYGLQAGNFTLAHYAELLLEHDKAMDAILNSLFLAVTASTICAILGTLTVFAVKGLGKKWGRPLEAVSLVPEMLPGIVMVIGLMLFWNDIYDILPLYNTLGILVLTYVVLFLPFSVQYVTSSLTQISSSLIEAGRVFGGNTFYVFRRITVPLILRGIAAGWMMTFIISLRELVAPSMIAPPNTLVISTFITREFEQGSVSLGMAMAVLCILITAGCLLVLNRGIKRF